ncbi:Uncharacterised protein [Salmonella enterica subsp. enterica serovar Bovismorbificans]|uniref:Uncharacterized protein n=1 Tax=Salmonella enterica subsp. enterica serovar Bovismorbificans TaxID=58097 RepID=A0A655BP89_SALET|nr:Uncharacterised protein [Salmonella enterica subsp. enterica serovar Bovismorbificans]
MEDHHKRAAIGFHLYPRIERQQHHQRTDVEQQNTVYHLIHRFRDAFLRIARFRRSNADQLQSAKRKHNHRQRQKQTMPTGSEETVITPEVINAGMFAAVAGEQQPQTKTYHADNRQHFNQREPEFRFAIQTNVHQIHGINDNKKRRRPYPCWYVRQPVLHIDARRGQLRHPDQHKHDPIVPARQKARKRPPIFPGEVGKRSGNRLFHDHFTQLAHNEKSDNPGNAIAQQNSRPRHLNRRADAQKQSGANGATQRD